MLSSILAQATSPSSPFGGGSGEEAVALGVGIAVLLVALVFVLAIYALVAWLLYRPYSKLPAEYQQLGPGLVWLFVIPIFNLFWMFVLAIKLPASFKAYFEAAGDDSIGDAGKGIGLACAICFVAGLVIPFVGLAGLVLLIIFIVKLWGMAGRIQTPGAVAMQP